MSVEKIHDFQFNSFEYNKVEDPKYGLGKTIYFTTDNKYAISFYTPKLIDDELVKRLRFIIYVCSKWIFDSPGGDFYKDKFSWPEYLIYENNQLATVTPVYPKRFFFGSDKSNKDSPILPGSLKEPYWFASPFNLNAYVPQKEKGNLLGFLNICLNLARGINKLHEFDLLPANISFNNCLVDPVSGSALIKEISHLIIDGISDYQLVESLEFIAPELVNNRFKSSKVKIPHSKETDRHALSVLIYYLLFHRHPLRGSAVYNQDEERNDLALFGDKALFIEDPNNTSNILVAEGHDPDFFPWVDTSKIPYTVLGPHLSPLFKRSFIDGLHAPSVRPKPDEWISAILKTRDMLYPCANPQCSMAQFVFTKGTRNCPYCGAQIKETSIPVFTFLTRNIDSTITKHHDLVIHNDHYIYPWHVYQNVLPNEFLTESQKKPVGYFSFFNNKWFFVNQTLTHLYWFDAKNKAHSIPVNDKIHLSHGLKLSLAPEPHGYYAEINFHQM